MVYFLSAGGAAGKRDPRSLTPEELLLRAIFGELPESPSEQTAVTLKENGAVLFAMDLISERLENYENRWDTILDSVELDMRTLTIDKPAPA